MEPLEMSVGAVFRDPPTTPPPPPPRGRAGVSSWRRRETSSAMSSHDVKRAKYSISAQTKPDWCHFCKCFVQTHANAKRMHEQSNAHKKNVELKMREVRKQKQNEGKEAEAMRRTMANIDAAAAAAYRADVASGARPEDASSAVPKSAAARAREALEGEKQELTETLEKELKASAEEEYREKGVWKFDERSNYYWNAKTAHYYDPKSGMFFDHKANAWTRRAPPGAPPIPVTAGLAAPAPEVPRVEAHVREPEGDNQYPLGPFSASAVKSAETASASGAGDAAAAKVASGAAGWSHASKQTAPGGVGTKPKSLTSMFNLGYGTNHPKYEAAKARTQSSASRALEGAGGRSFEAKGSKNLGVVGKDDGDGGGKRKRQDGKGEGKKPKVSKEEAAALAKREAARARVEARSMKAFGLQ